MRPRPWKEGGRCQCGRIGRFFLSVGVCLNECVLGDGSFVSIFKLGINVLASERAFLYCCC